MKIKVGNCLSIYFANIYSLYPSLTSLNNIRFIKKVHFKAYFSQCYNDIYSFSSLFYLIISCAQFHQKIMKFCISSARESSLVLLTYKTPTLAYLRCNILLNTNPNGGERVDWAIEEYIKE